MHPIKLEMHLLNMAHRNLQALDAQPEYVNEMYGYVKTDSHGIRSLQFEILSMGVNYNRKNNLKTLRFSHIKALFSSGSRFPFSPY